MVNFLTYLLLSVGCLLIAFSVQWGRLPGEFWLFSIFSGVAGAAGNGFLVKALQKGELSVLGPINAYKAVVGMLVGMALLREVPNAWGVIGITLIIGGSYFVLDTMGEKFSWALLRKAEIQYRIWAMILTAIEAVLIKKIILTSSPVVAFVSWCWFGAFFSFLLLLLYRINMAEEQKNTRWAHVGQYAILVLCIGAMQFSTNYVFEHMRVGYALSLFQLSLLVSVFLGHRVFGEKHIRKKLMGSAVMLAGSVVIILLKDA